MRDSLPMPGLNRTLAIFAWALAGTFALSACTGGGTNVADSTAMQEVRDASLASAPQGAAGMDPSLMQGTVMNVATQRSTEMTAFAPDPVPEAPDMATSREAAVQQIRAKAQAQEDEKPNVFERGGSSVQPLTPAEQEQLKAQLASTAARNRNAISADEAARQAEEIRRLRARAQSHYGDTVDQIE